ncbi:hypothetical protein CQW23_30941 [Capsicum baccatum]|uniref:DUF7746 domain-containing protein n=1 Tax=Capsicum baccatum TaxID=33114 RepID=A0A2G2V921_CAPBA|nr:hypothetical protein CQW23_30941 [Capsicum baccatum]
MQIEKSLYPIILERPGVGSSTTVGVHQQTNSEDSQPEEESPLDIALVKTFNWQKPQKLYYPRATPSDVALEERPNLMQNNYNANNIYEWNIDGCSEYNILSKLQQMTMVSTA